MQNVSIDRSHGREIGTLSQEMLHVSAHTVRVFEKGTSVDRTNESEHLPPRGCWSDVCLFVSFVKSLNEPVISICMVEFSPQTCVNQKASPSNN